MSEINEALADIPREDQTLEEFFGDKEQESPSDPPPENEPEGDKPAEGDDTQSESEDKPEEEEDEPFHKRWKVREEKLKTELREEFEQELEQVRNSVVPAPATDSETEVPDSFKRLYGDDPEAYKAFKSEIRRELEDEWAAKEQAQAEARQKEAEEAAYWQNWVKTELDTLEASGEKFDRNELTQVMLKYKPTTEDGNFDFQAGLEIYKALNPTEDTSAKSKARKQIADSITAPSKGEPAKRDFQTPETLRNVSWHSL